MADFEYTHLGSGPSPPETPLVATTLRHACKKGAKDFKSVRTLVLLFLAVAWGSLLTVRGPCDINETGNCPIISQAAYEVLAPSREYLQKMAEKRAATWFDRLQPLLQAFFSKAPATLGIKVPVIIGDFCNVTVTPPSLPMWTAGGSVLTPVERVHRDALWIVILFAKWSILVASTTVWYLLFIVFWQRLYPEMKNLAIHTGQDLRSTRLLFSAYHVSHHAFLFYMMNVALANGYVSPNGFGFDWELYDIWMDWLIGFVNMTAVMKYVGHRGRNLDHSIIDVALTLAPGLGNDMMLIKEFVFAGVAFAMAQWAQQLEHLGLAWICNTVGCITLLLSLCLFKDLYDHPAALIGFVRSHWPIVLATEKESGIATFGDQWWLKQALQQTNIAKQVQTEKQNIPQLFNELVFALALVVWGVGLHGFVVIAIGMSGLKVLVIRQGRALVATWIEQRILQGSEAIDGKWLLKFVDANGFSPDFQGRNALHVALEHGWHNIGLLDRIGVDRSSSPSVVVVGNGKIGAETWEALATLTQLSSLSIGHNNRMGPEGCKALATLTQLSSLSIGDCENDFGPEDEQELENRLPQLKIKWERY